MYTNVCGQGIILTGRVVDVFVGCARGWSTLDLVVSQ